MSPLRQLRVDDADDVAALFVSAYGAARQVDAEEIRSWLDNTEIRPEWTRVLVEGGRVVGYGDIWPHEGEDLMLDVAAPGYWAPFLDWAESEARDRGLPCVRAISPAGHELGLVCEERGYRYWRSSFTMEIDLDDTPGEPALPAGFRETAYRDTAHDTLIAALNDAFAADVFWHTVEPDDFREFYLRSRGFDPELWTLAWDGGELAGFALAYDRHGSDEELGWIGTLGVREAWRRRGLGEALLRRSFAKLAARGRRRAGLGVDAENVTGALRLYERAGMRKVGQVDNWALDL